VDKPRPFWRQAWSAKREWAILPMSDKYARMMDAARDAYKAGLESARADREAAAAHGDASCTALERAAAARSRAKIEKEALDAALRKRWPVPVHMRARRGQFLVALALDALASAGGGWGGGAAFPRSASGSGSE
jgi:hypothetical protein